MNKFAVLGSVLIATVCTPAHAGELQRSYFGFGLGGVLPGTADFLATNNVQLPGDNFESIVSQTIDLDPSGSVAASAWFGYQVTRVLALEAEALIQTNSFDDNLVDDDFDLGFLVGLDTGFNVSMVGANAVLRAPVSKGLQPFVGAGLGALRFGAAEDQLEDFDGDTVLGYQIKAGLQYRWSNGLALGVQWRYLAGSEAFERTFLRDVLQENGGTVPTELSEELEYAASDAQITFSVAF